MRRYSVMVMRRESWLVAGCFLAVLVSACSSDPVAVMSGDATAQAATPTTLEELSSERSADAVAVDSAPVEEPDEGTGHEVVVFPEFVPVPELSPEIMASEPLLAHMTFFEDFEGIEIPPEMIGYTAMIGASEYALVDDAGEPVVVRDGEYNKLRLSITAYHGEDVPVVYTVFMNHWSHIDPRHGAQSGDCDGGMYLGGLTARAGGRYELTGEMISVFDNRIFFGDYECGGVDLNPWPDALTGEFTAETSLDGLLIVNHENNAAARFSLLDRLGDVSSELYPPPVDCEGRNTGVSSLDYDAGAGVATIEEAIVVSTIYGC